MIPWRLALVTIMQFAENLTDRQAADAVRSRIDWKYALGLNLEDSDLDFSVLCKFRKRLTQHRVPHRLFDTMLMLFVQLGFVHTRGRQRLSLRTRSPKLQHTDFGWTRMKRQTASITA